MAMEVRGCPNTWRNFIVFPYVCSVFVFHLVCIGVSVFHFCLTTLQITSSTLNHALVVQMLKCSIYNSCQFSILHNHHGLTKASSY